MKNDPFTNNHAKMCVLTDGRWSIVYGIPVDGPCYKFVTMVKFHGRNSVCLLILFYLKKIGTAPVGKDLGTVFETGQVLTTNQNRPHMVSITHTSHEIQLQVIVK